LNFDDQTLSDSSKFIPPEQTGKKTHFNISLKKGDTMLITSLLDFVGVFGVLFGVFLGIYFSAGKANVKIGRGGGSAQE
jgi:hypothetical protein